VRYGKENMAVLSLAGIAETFEFPKGWGTYYSMRTVNELSVEEAYFEMWESKVDGWTTPFLGDFETVRNLLFMEMLTRATVCYEPAPCKCPRCR